MTIRSTLASSTLALTCAVSSTAFSKTSVCTDLTGSYKYISGGKVVDTLKIATTCDLLSITYSDGTTDVLKTEGDAEVLQTAANGRALESIAYYSTTAAGAGAALRITRYIIDPVGTLSVALILTVQFDAAKNLTITSSAMSITDAPATTVDTWTPSAVPVPPTTPAPPAVPGTLGLSKIHKLLSMRL